jgi:hypothetical protein
VSIPPIDEYNSALFRPNNRKPITTDNAQPNKPPIVDFINGGASLVHDFMSAENSNNGIANGIAPDATAVCSACVSSLSGISPTRPREQPKMYAIIIVPTLLSTGYLYVSHNITNGRNMQSITIVIFFSFELQMYKYISSFANDFYLCINTQKNLLSFLYFSFIFARIFLKKYNSIYKMFNFK